MTEVDLGASRAVLIGTWSYTSADLPDVPAARNSLELMRTTLTSDICGWPQSSVTTLRNPGYPSDLPDQLVQLFGEARDVALFYFVGHGQVDEEDQLCLCTARSVTEAPRRSTTSLGYGAVRRALQRSPARVKIVILDCCYSGIATEQANSLSGSSADLAVRARANGVYTMAASGPFGAAWFESTGSGGEPPLTYFTKNFATVLRDGIAGEPGRLRLNPIYLEVHSRLLADGKPSPTRRTSDTADEFEFARNAIPAVLQRDPKRENLELREILEAREKELENSRLEQKQLAEQLASMQARLSAETRKPAVADVVPPPEESPDPVEESPDPVEDVRQQTDRLADELRGAESRVREDEARVHELTRPKAAGSTRKPAEQPGYGTTRSGGVLRHRRIVQAISATLLVALPASGMFFSLLDDPGDPQGERQAPSSPASTTRATPTDGADASFHAASESFKATAPWRLETTGVSCWVELLNSSDEAVGEVYSTNDASGTAWLQVRSSGTFRYRISKTSGTCTARPRPGAGAASLPFTITQTRSDSLLISGVEKIRVLATPVEDQCDVLIRDGDTGKTLQEKIGNPGDPLTFEARLDGRRTLVSAGVVHCAVTVSATG
ncbi:caspase family protein [Actinoplanes awajinensis]|uniref:Peptidase C14 caspase domain-containing protein n=1 Tax=Actinoplanes awajinensis subsp. mycoplanecinus TaxID=135947 RepID=A0A101JS68_9ACTN|nr:caspase family protein [Actinoplanes awajinensis]KUL31728.1 hypothetical protein ADL15_21355 [Actinoplanes awajinensis subsp. mycoplanecinus]